MKKTELLIQASNLLSKIEDRIQDMQRDIALTGYFGGGDFHIAKRHFIRTENRAVIIELKNILSSKEAQRIIKEIKK